MRGNDPHHCVPAVAALTQRECPGPGGDDRHRLQGGLAFQPLAAEVYVNIQAAMN